MVPLAAGAGAGNADAERVSRQVLRARAEGSMTIAALAPGNFVLDDSMAKGATTRPVAPLLVAALRAQNRWAEAASILQQSGLPDPEKLTALRRQAEDALAEARYPAARGYAQTYLADDPDSAYVQSLYNSSLRDEYRMQADRLEKFKREQIRIARSMPCTLRRQTTRPAAPCLPREGPLAAVAKSGMPMVKPLPTGPNWGAALVLEM